MNFTELKIVAIVKRDSQGVLELVNDAPISEDDDITIITTKTGSVVVVIGYLSEEDEPLLSRLLENI